MIQTEFYLTSIRFSHFVEKVRWAMDYFGVSYRERPLMPIIHWMVTPFVIGSKGQGDSHSTRFSTPILKTDRGEVLIKSSRIMEYISDRFSKPGEELFPTDDVRRLDDHYNQFLGPHTRRLFYFNVLHKKEEIFKLADANVSPAQAATFKFLFSICKPAILKGLDINAQQVEKSIGHIYKEFEGVEKKLKDGRPFLTGDRFTAADISFACLGGALCLPQPHEGYGGKLPGYDSQCEQLVRISKEIRSTVPGKWSLNLFKEKRGVRRIPCFPSLA